VKKRCYFASAAIFFLLLVALRHYTSPKDATDSQEKKKKAVRCAVVVGLKRVYDNTTQGTMWNVLMEQRQVKNWLRSSRNRTALMAWPGEYAFPGGAMEHSDTDMEETAKRELQEELLGVQIPGDDFHVHLFDVISVKGWNRSYMVHIYVAFDYVNKWLETLQVQHLNSNLDSRMREFQYMLSTNEYWSLTIEQKMFVSPEVHKFEWMPLRTALVMATSPYIKYVNDFQFEEFQKYKVSKREPVGEQMIEVLETLFNELEAGRYEEDLIFPTG